MSLEKALFLDRHIQKKVFPIMSLEKSKDLLQHKEDVNYKGIRSKLSPVEYQELVWRKEIGIGIIHEIVPLLNEHVDADIPPKVLEILERAINEKHFGQKEVRELLGKVDEDRKERLEEISKEYIEKYKPELKN